MRPRVTVALGTTAAWALAGRVLTISQSRGQLIQFRDDVGGFVTVHPSYILRLRDQTKDEEYRRLVADLSLASELVPEVVR